MPIYEQKDYEETITRIQEKIAERNIKLGDCLSEEMIADFEKDCHIQLPQAYRIFLKYIGNGCDEENFPLRRLEEIERKDLSQPFMLEEAWIWEEDPRAYDVLVKEIQTRVYQGEMELIDFGCGDCYNLIVTGKCRGEVWNFSDVGIQPCCERQDFFGWFELWLDNQEKTDYFKDYIYR